MQPFVRAHNPEVAGSKSCPRYPKGPGNGAFLF
jgi:hypothetical protein